LLKKTKSTSICHSERTRLSKRKITECVILSEAAVALCQSQMNLLLERCCMGVVYQIEDLDNSSKDLKGS
jgi:hypothetical protein